MKTIAIVLFISLPVFGMAQDRFHHGYHGHRVRDSVEYYQRQRDSLSGEHARAFEKTDTYTRLSEKIEAKRAESSNYTGPILIGQLFHSNYSDFNKSIAANGFSPMKSTSWRGGIGVSKQMNRFTMTCLFVTVGSENVAKRGNDRIKSETVNVFQFWWGYDLIKSPVVNLYPYAGLTFFRISTLRFQTGTEFNDSYTNISNIVINDRTVNATENYLGYVAGLGLDVLLGKKKTGGNWYAVASAGMDRGLRKERYRVLGNNYKPGIVHGDWVISLGIKRAFWN